MTIIAGLWKDTERPDLRNPASAVRGMLAAQAQSAAPVRETRILGGVAFGKAADRPASLRSVEVRTASSGEIVLVADARIDNRADLAKSLGQPDDPSLDDETLILLAYRRWGEGVVDRLLGEFAVAAWEPARRTLTLLRDPTGQRPLYYRSAGSVIAFASLPRGLFAIDHAPSVDRERLASFVDGLPVQGHGTFYENISRVAPGQIIRIDRHGVSRRGYWAMPTSELRYRSDQDYIDAFREQLDRATQRRLRDAGSVVATHLSAGMDSSAVSATAARLMAPSGGCVFGITSAPRENFDGPVPKGWIADESPVAATVAARYPNVEHFVLRSSAASPLDHLDEGSVLFDQPLGHPCNNVWWQAAGAAARDRGATVMLTGETGNLTITAGGHAVLADLLQSGDLASWRREFTALHRSGLHWRTLMAASIGPWLPAWTWTLVHSISAAHQAEKPPILSRRRAFPMADDRQLARRTDRETRWRLLTLGDPGAFRKGAWLKWGIEERDPTADRDLIEFCFSLPPSQLLRDGQTRWLARSALSDRLPATVLQGVRGYQYADWFEAMDRQALTRFCDRIAASPTVVETIDLDVVRRLIEDWPPGEWASPRTIGNYRVGLLRTLSAGAFALNAGM